MMVMRTPVRMGRVSSREAARPTLFSVATNGSRPTRNASDMSNVDVCGKSAAAQALSEKEARPALTLTAASPASTSTSVVGKVAHDIAEEPCGHDDLALALHRSGQVGLDGEFHVGGEQVETTLARLQQDAGQDGKRAPRGDAASEDAELVDQR